MLLFGTTSPSKGVRPDTWLHRHGDTAEAVLVTVQMTNQLFCLCFLLQEHQTGGSVLPHLPLEPSSSTVVLRPCPGAGSLAESVLCYGGFWLLWPVLQIRGQEEFWWVRDFERYWSPVLLLSGLQFTSAGWQSQSEQIVIVEFFNFCIIFAWIEFLVCLVE